MGRKTSYDRLWRLKKIALDEKRLQIAQWEEEKAQKEKAAIFLKRERDAALETSSATVNSALTLGAYLQRNDKSQYLMRHEIENYVTLIERAREELFPLFQELKRIELLTEKWVEEERQDQERQERNALDDIAQKKKGQGLER